MLSRVYFYVIGRDNPPVYQKFVRPRAGENDLELLQLLPGGVETWTETDDCYRPPFPAPRLDSPADPLNRPLDLLVTHPFWNAVFRLVFVAYLELHAFPLNIGLDGGGMVLKAIAWADHSATVNPPS